MPEWINPGNVRKEIVVKDNIVYSTPKDLEGNPLELKLSVMCQKDGIEMRRATGQSTPQEKEKRPALLWIPGGGWRGVDKHESIAELVPFVDAGYVVACVYYRSSAQGHFPAQIIDVKTAVRFLRAHADQYAIDPERIGIFGRSAGGHLAAFAAMNEDNYIEGPWEEYSSRVQCCCDLFGPVDMLANMVMEEKKFADPKFRWHKLEDTHGGALLGGDPATMKERAVESSPVNHVNPNMCPILILHGDADPIVPMEVSSEIFWKKIEEAGLTDRAEYYIVKNGGHGSREFWQDSIKKLMTQFFDRHLKK